MTAEDGERGGTTVTCDGRLFHRRAAAAYCRRIKVELN